MKASLSSERWERVHLLFTEVIDLSPAERAARLDEECRDDPALREEVESLMEAYGQADDVLQVLDQIGSTPAQPSTPSQPSYTGAHVGHYEVLEQLGGGGMGVVYKALDARLKRIVALKFLPAQWSQDERAKQRFEHEAQAASALDHPNICTIYEIGETQPDPDQESDDGQLFIAMAYYDGQTLKRTIKQGPLPLLEALDIATQIARGLAKAHTKDIVHRDIKPANVILTDDSVAKILDFGLAKMADVQMTKTGTTLGTVAYMSPEQTRGEKVDHRTDVWSLGVVLYEMLTGERPFRGEYDQAVIYSLLNEEPVPLLELNSGLPEEVDHVVRLCLEKEKDLRYPSIADLLADLEVLSETIEAGAQPGTRTGMRLYAMQPKRTWTPPRPVVVGVGVLVVLLVLLVIPSLRQAVFSGGGSLPDQKYLAVLPFTLPGMDQEADRVFADGFVETLRGKLAQLEQYEDSLWVVPEQDMRAFEQTGPAEARQRFGANLAVLGRFERIEDLIRLTLSVVDTETLKELRATQVEGQPGNVAALQENVLTTMTDMLDIDLDPQIQQGLHAGGTDKPGASDYYLRGRGYLQRYEQLDQIDAAIQLFNRALEDDPAFALAMAGLGEAYWRKYALTKERPWLEEAETYCEFALEQKGDLAPVYVTRGLVLIERGQYGTARVMFERALEHDPSYASAYQGLAKVYENRGDNDAAEATYSQAVALKRGYWGGYNELGKFYFRKSRYEEAALQFRRVVELTPDNPLGYNNLGSTFRRLGRPQEAVELYLQSVEVQDTEVAYRNLGAIYYSEHKYAEAVAMYEKALELQGRIYRNWSLLANAYYWANQRDKARGAWDRMIELADSQLAVNPRDADALGHLAEAYAKLGGHEQEARAMIERMLTSKQVKNDHLVWISRAYEQLGERTMALEYLERALKNGITLVAIERSPWLEDLRTDPGYKKIEETYREMRES